MLRGMNPKNTGIMLGVIVAATFITGYLVSPHLGNLVVSHWNVDGVANGFMSRALGTYLMPVILLVLWGLWALLPAIDPIAKGFKGFRYVYDFFWVLLMAFLAYAYAITLGINLGWEFDMFGALFPALAVLIFVLGALLPYIKRNWFFGVRTPWTLSSDVVWNKTHQFTSALLMLAAACVLAGAFVPHRIGIVLAIVPLALAALAGVVYSYIIYARNK